MRGDVRWIGAALLLIWSALCLAVEEVHYPTLPSAHDPNETYTLAMLQLGLKKSGKAYRLVADTAPMLQGRAIQEASNPAGSIDVLWTMTTPEREAQLLPIRIPIDKGLLGWRVPLLRADRLNLLAGASSLAGLRRWTAGQGHDWPDTEILQGNGLNVVTSSQYDSLFRMLQAGRFDYFPRSVMEIWNDVANHPDKSLVVDSHIAIHYPAAAYFFVTPRRPQLAKDLEAGLERAIADGSFEALFRARLGPFVERARLQRRHVIELANPLLDKTSLPLDRPELWYRPH